MVYTFDSSMTGAPVLSGTAGALRAVLKACMVDGFGAGAVATLTVAAGIATASFAGAHPYRVGTIAQFGGATPAGLNGQKRIFSTTASAITFDATGIADGTATGTITHKVAAAGWQELFAGSVTNVLCLKPTVVEATGCVLRIDDTDTTTARTVGYESMSSASAGVGVFPTAAQISGGMYWGKSNAGDASARPWMLFADARCFLLYVAPNAAYSSHGVLCGWGDLASNKSGDAYACAINGGATVAEATTTATAAPGCLGYAHGVSAGANLYVARAATAIGSAQMLKKVAAHNTAAAYSGIAAYNGNALKYPNGPDNSLRLSPLELLGDEGLRGRIPGVLHTPQGLASAFATGDVIDGEGSFAGRRLVALRVGPPGAVVANAGTVFIDSTGPWSA